MEYFLSRLGIAALGAIQVLSWTIRFFVALLGLLHLPPCCCSILELSRGVNPSTGLSFDGRAERSSKATVDPLALSLCHWSALDPGSILFLLISALDKMNKGCAGIRWLVVGCGGSYSWHRHGLVFIRDSRMVSLK